MTAVASGSGRPKAALGIEQKHPGGDHLLTCSEAL